MKKFNIEGIGELTIRKSQKAKRLIIRIRSGVQVEVVLPVWVPYKTGIDFARKKKGWIIKQISKNKSAPGKNLVFDEQTNFRTRWHELIISNEVRENINIYINSSSVRIRYPSNLKTTDEMVQKAIRYGITETLRLEAKEFLPDRIKSLAEKHGFRYKRLFFKNQKTLWGSCSSANNININIHIMRLPQYLLDYILIHELVHTVHKNHGKDFWKSVDQCVGNGKTLAKELKAYSILLTP